jgi:hypothetical protein
LAQNDYIIDNQTAPNFRADLNNVLQAIVSNNSGTSAPTVTYANMIWYDTTNKLLRMRSEADDAWITLGTLNQVAGTFAANVALASQAEAQAGTENTKTMTPLRVAQAIGQANAAPVKTALNASGSAPIYAARAWVNFKGTGTVAIRASGNVSSITDNGTGDYTVNFATAMASTNYQVSVTATGGNTNGTYGAASSDGVGGTTMVRTTSSVRFLTRRTSTFGIEDCQDINVAIFE